MERVKQAREQSAAARGEFQTKAVAYLEPLLSVLDAFDAIGVSLRPCMHPTAELEFDHVEKSITLRFGDDFFWIKQDGDGWKHYPYKYQGCAYHTSNPTELVDVAVMVALESGDLWERFTSISDLAPSGLSPAIETALSGLAPTLARARED
jgi:hypothetical protein